MRDFQVLFDHGERSALLEPEMARYGKLGFPASPGGRPWIFSNFAVTMDGLVSLLGDESSGGDIARLDEDRWLMDLLRAHADAVMLGMGTLRERRASAGLVRAVPSSAWWTPPCSSFAGASAVAASATSWSLPTETSR